MTRLCPFCPLTNDVSSRCRLQSFRASSWNRRINGYSLSVLTTISAPSDKPIRNAAAAIVAARYNSRYTDALVESASRELAEGGVTRVEVVRVPGSFEIPVVASRLTKTNDPHFEAIICFGVIFQGETTHAENIAEAVSLSLAALQVESGKPVIHGVFVFQNEEQAEVRCLGAEHNRGIEAARTAIEMIRVMRALQNFEREEPIF